MPQADQASQTLERNLAALRGASPATVDSVRAATAHPGLQWSQADDGRWVASLDGRALASKRRPMEEAERFASGLDPQEAGAAVVTGFASSHHVQAVCGVMGKGGVVLCYEPDLRLLRSVLERIDCSEWIARSNLAIMTDEADTTAISSVLRGVEGVVSLGVKIMHHQPSRLRLGERADTFCNSFTAVIQALRTTVVTTLMQTETTLRNLLGNADWYAGAPGAGELANCARGRAAVVVSAGPSLGRNLHLLGKPGVRDRVVIIAVQTVLKTMLDAGIKPHFVVAVDYHEISKRFYEGLTARDVEGVTLLCDPKANPVICDTFPGAVRTLHDGVLQSLLGENCTHDTASVPASATVAHLAYSSARLMGCDPVVLVGQDLGFSDGLYYGPGAAIHDVWAGELNSMRTLETLEWERIARGRPQSRRVTDVHGKPIYTDEQMHTYLVQFERMFAEDAKRGLRVIDATEGGVAKQHTEPMKLADVLAEHAVGEPIRRPACVRDEEAREASAQRVAEHLGTVRAQVIEVGAISLETAAKLGEMLEAGSDQGRINALIESVQENARRVAKLEPGYSLAQYLNQTGTLKRFKADRSLHYLDGLTPEERQTKQIERDTMNVTWLADAAGQLEQILTDAEEALRTGDKPTADPRDHASKVEVVQRQRIAAVIAVDPELNTLGRPRDLSRAIAGGENALRRTLRRLAACESIDHAVLLTEDPERARLIAGEPLDGLRVSIDHVRAHPLGDKRGMVASARRIAPASWRGGLGGATVFDEIVSAPPLLKAMQRHDLTGAVAVGCDWAALDPGLTDLCVRRHTEHPTRNRMVFTQAAPGLAPIVLERSLVEELAPHEGRQRLWTSMAGLFAYTPVAPIADPIAKSLCVRVDPAVRDIPIRCVADGSWHAAVLSRAVRAGAENAGSVASWLSKGKWPKACVPMDVTFELCTGRLVGGQAAITRLGRIEAPERKPIDTKRALAFVRELAEASPGAMLTLAGAGDPLLHPSWEKIAIAAKSAGLGVHVRTDLLVEGATDRLVAVGPDVVSVDHYAGDAQAYLRVAGAEHFDRLQTAMGELIELRDARAQAMWIVPRIARCDEVLDQIEAFYDRWLVAAGACVIDRPWNAAPGQRVQRLPLPALTQQRRRAWSLRVRCDGIASRPGNLATADLSKLRLLEAWTKLRRARKPARVAA